MKTLEPNNVIIKSRKRNEFAFKVFNYFYNIDRLKSIEPYITKCESKYKVQIPGVDADLKGLLFKGSLNEVKVDNSRKVKIAKTQTERIVKRWYESALRLSDATYFLSNQWSLKEGETSKSNPTIEELQKVITYCYKGYIISYDSSLLYLIEKENKISMKYTNYNTNSLIEAIFKTGLIYSKELITRFAFSILTKPFVILSGLAGSGKTQLALAFAKALCEDITKQICFVSVGADWTNREPLLGYPNALQSSEYVLPETGVLQLIINAEKEPRKPYFLILDEMNLSYVERYFADFLSAMEASGMPIKLWEGSNKIPSSVKLPKNIFIIGTINVDETTYMFSPKVLDRANVIEFKVSPDEMDRFLSESPDVDLNAANGMAAFMATSFVDMAQSKPDVDMTIIKDVLNSFFKELKTVNAEFGYRTASEISRFIAFATKDGAMKIEEAIDAAIVQKLLPKLHGSRQKLVSPLKKLWVLCEPNDRKSLEEADVESPLNCKYKLSADKIYRMYRSAVDNGFTSFSEA